MDESKLVVFSLAIGAIGLYGTFVPTVSDVAMGHHTPQQQQVLRESELIGSAQLIAVAGIASYLSKSALPVFLALFLVATMFATYEYAMIRVVRDDS